MEPHPTQPVENSVPALEKVQAEAIQRAVDLIDGGSPPVHNEHDASRSALDAEFQDDPSCTLENLPPEDQRRVRLKFFAVRHGDNDMTAIRDALALARPDYVILEATWGNGEGQYFGSRQEMDHAINLQVRGLPNSHDDKDLTRYAAVKEVLDAAAQGGYDVPIIRTMDVDEADASPDPRYPTHGQLKAELYRLENSFWEDEIFLRPGSALRDDLRRVIELWELETSLRNLAQKSDASRIAANAAERHQDKPEIVVAVVSGVMHDEVLGSLVTGTDVQHDPIVYIPENSRADQDSHIPGAVRALSHGDTEVLSEARMDRMLLGMTVFRSVQGVLLPSESAAQTYPTVMAFINDPNNVPDDRVVQITGDIDNIKLRATEDQAQSAAERAIHIKFGVVRHLQELAKADPKIAKLVEFCNRFTIEAVEKSGENR